MSHSMDKRLAIQRGPKCRICGVEGEYAFGYCPECSTTMLKISEKNQLKCLKDVPNNHRTDVLKDRTPKKRKFSKKQKAVLGMFWRDVQTAQEKYWRSIGFIEKQAKHVLEISIEVFHVDGCPVGFGDYDRKYELYQEVDDE